MRGLGQTAGARHFGDCEVPVSGSRNASCGVRMFQSQKMQKKPPTEHPEKRPRATEGAPAPQATHTAKPQATRKAEQGHDAAGRQRRTNDNHRRKATPGDTGKNDRPKPKGGTPKRPPRPGPQEKKTQSTQPPRETAGRREARAACWHTSVLRWFLLVA